MHNNQYVVILASNMLFKMEFLFINERENLSYAADFKTWLVFKRERGTVC